jgi:hypothetical protein
LVRLFALLVAVLALSAQQRVVKSIRLAPAAATSVVTERPESIERNAVRASSSVRVAPPPFLERLPVLPVATTGSRAPRERLLIARAVGGERAQLVTHFHAKRRIPRMNSEEPPRG